MERAERAKPKEQKKQDVRAETSDTKRSDQNDWTARNEIVAGRMRDDEIQRGKGDDIIHMTIPYK